MILVTIVLGLCFAVFLYWFFISVVEQFFEKDVKICYRCYPRSSARKPSPSVDYYRDFSVRYPEIEAHIGEVNNHSKSA